MNATAEIHHWQLEQDQDDIVWLSLDRQDTKLNSLSLAVLQELEAHINDLVQQSNVKGLVLMSGKPGSFIAGADIDQFSNNPSPEAAADFIELGQSLFQKISDLPFPTVAMIDGFCLGGGFELALACDYRVATQKARLGLPEVKLGIQPGWGGSVRLPRLIGILQAMPLMLSGRMVKAKPAKKLGLIDAAVPLRQLVRAARYFIQKKPAKQTPAFLMKLLDHALLRPWVSKLFLKALKKKARKAHYPAPYAMIDNWQKHGVSSDHAFSVEAKSIVELFQTDTCKNLLRVFRLREHLKSSANKKSFSGQHIHVIGAGVMGGDIAACCALSGFSVTLQDNHKPALANTLKRAHKLFSRKLKDPYQVTQAMDRLLPDPEGHGVQRADLIIEAISENLEAKRGLFQSLEAQAKPTAILATNTSSIPLDEINTVLQSPERLVGIHFFNPVPMMPLVEIVKGAVTDETIIQQSKGFVNHLDKLPLVVKSSPGFLVNRILMPYLMESVMLLDEGVSAEKIDRAALEFGMPMGPITLADQVGLDICLSVANNLCEALGGTVPESLKKMVDKGLLGKKSGRGFYTYEKGRRVKNTDSVSSKPMKNHDISQRMILRLLNEGAACLREGVVESQDDLDAGMVFGSGFAPFRGGVMHYAESQGAEKVQKELQALKDSVGDRFAPDTYWETH